MIRPATLSLVLAITAMVPTAADEGPPAPGMSSYRFGLLRKGPTWTARHTPASDTVQAGHLANINRMAAEGVLVAAGPLLDGGDLRGILVFRADSTARLRSLVARDPAVRSGRLVLDLFEWSAPAGIGEPYRRMATRPGFRDSMVSVSLVLLRRGPKWTEEDTDETRALQEAHMRGIVAGLASGELATAGPVTDGGELRGVLVYRADSTGARQRALADPAVRAGWLAVELHPWLCAYGTMPGGHAAGRAVSGWGSGHRSSASARRAADAALGPRPPAVSGRSGRDAPRGAARHGPRAVLRAGHLATRLPARRGARGHHTPHPAAASMRSP